MVPVQQSTEQRLIAGTTTAPPTHHSPTPTQCSFPSQSGQQQKEKKYWENGKPEKRNGPLIVSMSGRRAQQLIEGQAVDMENNASNNNWPQAANDLCAKR